MAKNRLFDNRQQLFAQAADMAAGLHLKEAQAGIKQNTEAALRADLEAAKLAHNAYNKALAANVAFKTAETAADEDGKIFIGAAKRILTIVLGDRWSPAWLPAGFTNSLAIPSSLAERQLLLESLDGYLQAHPEQQNAPLNVTSAQAAELAKSLKAARSQVGSSAAALTAAREARDHAEQALRWRMSGLIAELEQLLDDNDPSWYAFGLNRPSDRKIPAVPADVVVTAGLPGSIHVQWASAARARRYKIYKKTDGDADYQPIATTSDPIAVVNGLKIGATIYIQVTAANKAGESLPSSPAEFVVPGETLSTAPA
jgi:hypothetical protein